MALSADNVLDMLRLRNRESDDEGLSTDEEDDLNHLLADSASDPSESSDGEEDGEDEVDVNQGGDGELGESSGERARSPIRERGGPTSVTSTNRGRGSRGRGRVGRVISESGRARGGSGRARGGRGRVGRGDNDEMYKSYDHPDVGNNIPAFKPKRPPGIHFEGPVLRGGMTTALHFFRLFLTTDMIKSVVAHTNSYAYMKILAGGHNSYLTSEGSWAATTEAEINNLIAILIYFGLVRVDSDVEKYWSTKTLYHGLWARSILSRIRYKALMAFLHVVDPANETPGDKLRKVDEFLASFKKRCSLLYQPHQNIAVDERMVKSKAISGIRQYMKNKPTKWGIKLWVLADSSNGYTIDFNVYIGKSKHDAPSSHGLGYDVVMKLVNPYLGQGYHVYFDNFFSSPKEEIIREICGLPEYDVPPVNEFVPPAPPPDDQFCTVHLIRFTPDVRRHCVVCYAARRGKKKVTTYCSAPQCNRYMHASGEFECFSAWHSRDYPHRS
ncbi:uncharacterized protein LOC114529600 isoform X2 [Dendronephthya gigantea]|uniref:uncharacterized protein LOC114529600 isoform X2 n=1 Tax=Dendronephthya gigantea TaxID=151771 RepID=UPI001068DC44|nr:uncharacterized protein LOC114529600 isoform X2 [Dendronephthya gigantea]